MSLKQAYGLSTEGAMTIIIPLIKIETKKELAIIPANNSPVFIECLVIWVNNENKSVTVLPKANKVTPATLSFIRKSFATALKEGQKLKID